MQKIKLLLFILLFSVIFFKSAFCNTLYSWGSDVYGKLGNEEIYGGYIPQKVIDLNDAISISAGAYHSLALKSDGSVWAWGSNLYGELGNGSTEYSDEPLRVLYINDAILISAGLDHSLCAFKEKHSRPF